MNKIFLDAREMEHPKPLQISLSHLQSMSDDEYLYMLSSRKPIPLLEIATGKGFLFLTHEDENDTWHILISKNSGFALEELLDV